MKKMNKPSFIKKLISNIKNLVKNTMVMSLNNAWHNL